MKRAVMLVVALASGCGPSAKYDAVHDSSTIYQDTGAVPLAESQGGPARLILCLVGDGPHPPAWSCTLMLARTKPDAMPAFLGGKPTLTIDPHSRFPRKIESKSRGYHGSRSNRVEHVSFEMTIDELVRLSESEDTTLNDHALPLSPASRKLIQDVIAAARAATNAKG